MKFDKFAEGVSIGRQWDGRCNMEPVAICRVELHYTSMYYNANKSLTLQSHRAPQPTGNLGGKFRSFPFDLLAPHHAHKHKENAKNGTSLARAIAINQR